MTCTGISFGLVLLAASFVAPQPSQAQATAHVTLLTSPDAPGRVTPEQLNRCVLQLAEQWKIKESALPKIVVFHVSQVVARHVSLSGRINIRRNRSNDQADSYYEVWLVGDISSQSVVLAIENVLENYFGLHVSDQQRVEVVTRVSRFQDATISAFANR